MTNESSAAEATQISLPKGGGAIRGMGEKFSANPVTGTGSMAVPLATSPGRSGFAPQLSLSYDSGSGNGPFGFGWSLSVPAITRKTDRGLSQYRAGAEDLVPVLQPDGTRFEDDATAPGYAIHRYRPRIEGLFAYQRKRNQPDTQPAVVYTLAREAHDADLDPGQRTKIQHSFSYSDGFVREIQTKIQVEPGPVIEGDPVVDPRWVGSGWTIFNNKGRPVRQYEPFFSATHRFEFGVQVRVSPILFYDPVERVVAAPQSYPREGGVDPWQHTTWDVNATVLDDPRTDIDVQGYTAGYFESLPASPPAPPWQIWHAQRQNGALGPLEQAAGKAAAHADTPTTAYSDTLGRPFVTVAPNKVVSPITTWTALKVSCAPCWSAAPRPGSGRCTRPASRHWPPPMRACGRARPWARYSKPRLRCSTGTAWVPIG